MTHEPENTFSGSGPDAAPRVSVAIPVLNEEDTLHELIDRVQRVLDELPGGPHELLFVDDGSSGGSLAVLEAHAARRDPRIVIVELSRNFGHQTAVTAAVDHIEGDVTIIMDGDLQDLPEAMPLFLERFKQGFDVVYPRRVRRKEGPLLRAAYHLAYRVISRLSNLRLPLDAGDFSLLSRRVVDALRRMPERHRYVRGLRAWVGYRQASLDVERAARVSGRAMNSFLFNLSRIEQRLTRRIRPPFGSSLMAVFK